MRAREARIRPVVLLQTLLLGALVLVAVVSLNYTLPHAGRGPASAGGAGSSSDTHHLAGRKLGVGDTSHQSNVAGGKKRSTTTEAATSAVLTVHLHCGDQVADCKQRRHSGMCSTNLTHDFDTCMATCGVCPALAAALRASMNLTAAQLLVTPARGPPACEDEHAGVCAALVADTDTASACAAAPSAVLGACKATCKACSAPAYASNGDGGGGGADDGGNECFDTTDMCGWWAAHEPRICERAAADMQRWWWVAVVCRRTCGLCGGGGSDGGGTGDTAATAAALRKAASYGVQVGEDGDGTPRVAAYEALPADATSCKDKEAKCAEWVAAGECQKNSGFMAASCAASCSTCPVALNLPRPLAKVRLNNGVLMPTVGYGCAGLGESAGDTVQWALEAGYRHLDSAQAREWYREDLVGRALNRFLDQSAANATAAGGGSKSVRREDIFITSKLHPRHLGYEVTLRQFNETLKDLRSSYVDLFLLHYPECWGDLCGGVKPAGTFQDSWRALEAVYEAGLARAIGISNFAPHQVTQLLAKARVRPAVLQVHVDPLDHADALQSLCRAQGITLTAYSTLGTQYGGGKNPVLTSPVLAAIGQELGEAAATAGGQASGAGSGAVGGDGGAGAVAGAAGSQGGSSGEGRGGEGPGGGGGGGGVGVARGVAQVALRWALQQGLVVLPRSSNRGRIAQNLQLYDWSLTPAQMRRIEAL